jgi:hypothetical protein
MKYKVNIHKRYAYIKPTPKKDIPDGLVLLLNNPLPNGEMHFISTNVQDGVKEYRLPELEQGDYIKSIFVKDEV